MGQETSQSFWTKAEEKKFALGLQEETKKLKQWIQEGRFKNSPLICGYEVEGWIINKQALPYAFSEKLLKAVKDPHITPELSTFNFEINGRPFELKADGSQNLEKDFQFYWKKCSKAAEGGEGRVLFIGAYPDITQVPFGIKQIFPQNRYYAINDRILFLRKGPAKVHIQGRESLSLEISSVMHEAVTTSLQIHLQVAGSQAKDFYNSALLASPIMSALCANSPFICGKELWEESRIPLFEQVISLKSTGHPPVSRVGLGHGFVNQCVSELFEQNLFHPILLAETKKGGRERFQQLLLHNGSIWRWNRLLLGFDESGEPHFRIEHRVPSAGPSLLDMQANIIFFIGLISVIRKSIVGKTPYMAFPYLEEFFYRAGREGLLAEGLWRDGKSYKLSTLISKKLIPLVWEEIKLLSLDNSQTDYWVNDVIKNRVSTLQTGSAWQKAFIHKFGKKFDKMIQTYWEHQQKNIPVYQWEV